MAERTGQVGRVRRGGGVSDPRREDEDADFDDGGGRRRGRGLASVLVLAASGLLVYLAWSIMWERNHPAGPAALRVRQGDAAARLKVIRELERLGPEDPEIALPALSEAMADPEPFNRTAAVDGMLTVIQHVGPGGGAPEEVGAAVAALLDDIDDPQPVVRRRVVQALWTVSLIWQGTPRVLQVDRMIEAMARMAAERDPELRSMAVRGLGVVGRRVSEDPPRPLLAALDDESEAVRNAAALLIATYHRGLAHILPPLVKAMETARPECRPSYRRVLEEIRPNLNDSPPTEDLIAALAAALGSRDREVRRQVAATLALFEDRARGAIPALVALLGERERSGSPGRPAAAGPATGGDGRTREDGPADPAIAAIAALKRVAGLNRTHDPYGRETIVPPVQEVVGALKPLLASPDARRRAGAIDALRSFAPDPALVPALGEAVGDRDAAVRVAALGTVREYADGEEGLEFPPPAAIARALEDDEPQVRRNAAQALGAIRRGVEPMVPALIRHAGHDPIPEVRGACADTLGRLRPTAVTAAALPNYVEALDDPGSPSELREALIEGLMRFGPEARPAVPAIIRALRSAEARSHGVDADMRALMLRDSAARALGRLAPGTPFAPEAIGALSTSLDDRAVPVARSLGEFGPAARAAAPAMLRVLRQAGDRRAPRDVASSAEALRRIAPGTPEADEALGILKDVLGALGEAAPSADEVIAAIAGFGARAAPALPRLRELAGARSPQVQDAARKAVAAIEGTGR